MLVSPPFLLNFMYLVYRQDKHSSFYVAPRIGKDGSMFKMLKLRPMSVNADKSGVDSTSVDNVRITLVVIKSEGINLMNLHNYGMC